MIEKMKKIAVLTHDSNKKLSLGKLQNLGLMHLNISEGSIGENYKKILKKKKSYESLLNRIVDLANKYKNTFDPSKINNLSLFPDTVSTQHQRMMFLEKSYQKLENMNLAMDEMKTKLELIEPWGDFDWDQLSKLENHKIRISFYITTESILEKINISNYCLIPISNVDEKVYLMQLAFGEEDQELDFENVQIPRVSLSELKKNLSTLEKSIVETESFLAKFITESQNIQKVILGLDTLMDSELAKSNLINNSNGVIYAITGYIPQSKEKEILAYLKEEDMSYHLMSPTVEDDVPILLKNNIFAKFFEPITKIFSLPKYVEIDPTMLFAPFFTLFFGLCLGDVGYGSILLILSIAGWIKVPKKFKAIPILLMILSVSTIFSGILLNTIFGEAIFKVAGSESYLFEEGGEIAVFSSYTIEGKTIYPAMTLALLLGFVQLSFATFLQSINLYRSHQNWEYTIKPISVLAILWGGAIIAVYSDFLNLGFNKGFHIGILAIGSWLHLIPESYGTIVFFSGIVGFFLFNNPDKKILARPLFGIWESYQLVTGFLGDFLSYIRLFALGLASGLLGNAFNQVAFMILPDGTLATPLVLFSIIILVLGHSLNLGLSILGSFVHPLRLTFVEFYKNMNFVGGGQEYKPFSISKEYK